MEHVWKQVGHRPSANEWNAQEAKVSFKTYVRYFDGWQNACLRFIEYKMGGSVLSDDEEKTHRKPKRPEDKGKDSPMLEKSRTIP